MTTDGEIIIKSDFKNHPNNAELKRIMAIARASERRKCEEIAKRQMDLLVMENTKRVMDKESEGFSEYLKSNLQAIIDNDKTPKYEYGNEDENKNAKGQLPSAGERWTMPREIAASLLADNKGWERTHVDDFKTYQKHNEMHMLGDNIHPECAFCKCEQTVREEILPLIEKEAYAKGQADLIERLETKGCVEYLQDAACLTYDAEDYRNAVVYYLKAAIKKAAETEGKQ